MDKLCKDCKHFKYEWETAFAPLGFSVAVVPVGIILRCGKNYRKAEDERKENLIFGSCGPEAKYFEPQEVKDV